MDFPDEKGTYVLIAFVPQLKRIEVGQLGQFDIVPGFYVYVGSAFGAGGLAARIGHHLESAAELPPPLKVGRSSKMCQNDLDTYVRRLKSQRSN